MVVLERMVFVHAGLSAKHIRYYRSLDRMNATAVERFTDSDYHTKDYGVRATNFGKVIGLTYRWYAAAPRTLPPCLGGTSGGAFDTTISQV